MNLDELRAALTSSRNARVEEIEIDLEGMKWKVGVQQPSMAVQGRLLNALQKAAKAESPADLNAVKVDFALECVIDPESRKPVFGGEKDANGKAFRESLKAQPCGGWIERVYEIAMRLMHSPNQKTCRAVKEDGSVCGGELMLSAPKCPWCGADVPALHAMEAAEKNS